MPTTKQSELKLLTFSIFTLNLDYFMYYSYESSLKKKYNISFKFLLSFPETTTILI